MPRLPDLSWLPAGAAAIVAGVLAGCVSGSGGAGSGGGQREMEEQIGRSTVAVHCSVAREGDGSLVYSVDRVLKAPSTGFVGPGRGETLITLPPGQIPSIVIADGVTMPHPVPDYAIVCVRHVPQNWWGLGGPGDVDERVTIYHGVKSVAQSMTFTYRFPEEG